MEEPTDNLLVQTLPRVMLPEGQISPAALSSTQSDSGPAQPSYIQGGGDEHIAAPSLLASCGNYCLRSSHILATAGCH